MNSFTKVGFLLLILVPQTYAAQNCSQDAVRQAAAEVKAVQKQLLAEKVEEMDPSVTPTTQAQIQTLKDSLNSTITAYLHCQSGKPVDVKEMESTLAGLLGANKPASAVQPPTEQTPKLQDQIYGSDLKIAVSKPESEPQLVAIQGSFGVSCGMDTILLIYEPAEGNWQQVVHWQSGSYDQISGAFGDFFDYVVLPRKKQGQWLVATAHGFPWCTSRWSAFDLDVIEPSASKPQRVLFHRHEGYVRDYDPIMKAKSDGFEIRLEKGSLDTDVMTRKGIYRYRIMDDEVQRVQPIAMNGRDFVDEWLQSDWKDAVNWSEKENVSNLETNHAKITQLMDQKSKRPHFNFGPVRGCSDNAKHFQVELDQNPGEPTYFQIIQGENSFLMLSALPTPDLRCKGANLMPKS